jgi:hypothetical protein
VKGRRGPGGALPAGDYVVLEVGDWPGKRITETEMAEWIDLSSLPATGLWVFYRDSCELCAEHLEILALREMGERAVGLIRLPDEPDAGAPRVEVLPQGVWVTRVDLPDTVDWVLTVPAEAVVERGRVVSAQAAIQPGH